MFKILLNHIKVKKWIHRIQQNDTQQNSAKAETLSRRWVRKHDTTKRWVSFSSKFWRQKLFYKAMTAVCRARSFCFRFFLFSRNLLVASKNVWIFSFSSCWCSMNLKVWNGREIFKRYTKVYYCILEKDLKIIGLRLHQTICKLKMPP